MVKILIMDDEQSLRNIVFNTLKPLGHPMFTAEDGRQAIEIAKREIPDLAMLDMRVPDMDGLEVLVELKKINPNIRAVMLSGFGDVETAVNTLKQGAFDYLSKPFKVDEVLKVVNRAIQSLPQSGASNSQPQTAAPSVPQKIESQQIPVSQGKTVSSEKSVSVKKGLPKTLIFASIAGIVILAGLAAFKFMFKGGTAKEFAIPYSNPIGMCWIKPNLWVTDWVSGNIYQHNNDANFSIASVCKTNNTQPTGITFDGESLWTCSSFEKRIYKHKMDANLKIEAIFATPNSSPAGLYWDGANLWILDSTSGKIYKHKIDETLSVLGVYDSPAVNPCGMFRNGEYFYIGDYKTSKIYKVSTKDFSSLEIYTIPGFSDGKLKLSSITWDGENIWASADGVGKIFCISFSKLKPVKF